VPVVVYSSALVITAVEAEIPGSLAYTLGSSSGGNMDIAAAVVAIYF